MTILIQYRKFIFFQVIYRALCMLFDEIYVNFANYDEIAELLKVIEHVHDLPKTITSSIQIIQILTKRNGKRTQYFIVKVHLSNMNLLLHISSLRTL